MATDRSGNYIPVFPNYIPNTNPFDENGTGRCATITTSTTGDCPFTLSPYNEPLSYTINFSGDDDKPESAVVPKCYKCQREIEAMTTHEHKGYLVVVLHCHGEERRVDIALKRFKDCKEDALEWFGDTFDWLFDEEPKWRYVQPDEKVSTVHADRQIITDWLEKKS